MNRPDPKVAAALVALLAGVVGRLIYLEADPAYPLWQGYITDEGRWTGSAREWTLFGTLDIEGLLPRIHLLLAPAYQSATAILFALFGVGFASARLVSALSGCGLLLAAFVFLHRRLSPTALLLAMLLLALQPDLLFFSRVAIPEMAAMLFEFSAFALLVGERASARTAFVAGVLTAAGLGLKATAAPVVPIFMVIAFALHRQDSATPRIARVGTYLAGVLTPALMAFVLLAVLADAQGVTRLADSMQTLGGFVQPASPYSAASLLLYRNFSHVLNVLLLCAWSIAGVLVALRPLPDTSARSIYVGSAIWTVGWLGVSSAVEYFPWRYVVHALLPLVLNIGAGLTLLRRLDSDERSNAFAPHREWRRIGVAVWWCLPTAVLLCPLLIAAADASGIAPERLRAHATMIVVLDVGLGLALLRWRALQPAAAGLVVLPLLVAPLWLLGRRAGVFDRSFWTTMSAGGVAAWALLLLVATVGAWLLISRHAPTVAIRRCASGYIAAIVAIWLSQTVPQLISPTYTIVSASTDLRNVVGQSTLVGTGRAASMFLENRLHYTEQLIPLPRVLVVAFDAIAPPRLDGYRLVRQYELELGEIEDPRSLASRLSVYRQDTEPARQ